MVKNRTCNKRETMKINNEKTRARYTFLKVKKEWTNAIEKIIVKTTNTIEG